MRFRGLALASDAAQTLKRGSPRLVDSIPRPVVDDIFSCAIKKQTGVTLRYMLDFGANPVERQLILSSQFLHNELPVRLAHRVAELENLPYGLSAKPHVLKVRDWYVDSFTELRAFPPIKDARDEAKFTDLLRMIYGRHSNVVPVMAMGVADLKRELRKGAGLTEFPEIHQFLDGFYLSRIGIRILIGQHIALHEPQKPDHIGMICTKCSPVQVVHDAVADARSICMREYASAPEVVVYGDPDLSFAYVPSHLHQMVFELVKNSLKATNDKYEDADHEAPPVKVIVADGEEDIAVKVADEGGGIPRSGMPRIWTYLYTTSESPLSHMSEELEGADGPAVMAGYGVGLPISRLYARYFGGDLNITSMEKEGQALMQGYGTDALLHLHRLGSAEEPLMT